MTTPGDVQWFYAVQAAFPDEELRKRIWTAAHQPNQLPRLFEDISRYVLSLKMQQENSHELSTNQKKRKLDDGTAQANGTASADIASPVVAFECKDVSVQIPARKKLRVQIVGDAADARRNELRLLNSTTNDIEYALPAQNIDQVFCLPVPDKQQRQSYFAVFARPTAPGAEGEQILFTLTETSPPSLASSTQDPVTADDTYITATLQAFTRLLQHYGKSVTVPNAAEFASARPQSHRKGEKGYHVNAHRGSKEGTQSQHHPRNYILLTQEIRLPLLPPHRHTVRVQETPRLLPLSRHREHLVHICAAADVQSRDCIIRSRRRRL
jgi:hypothetical protein